MPMPMPTLPIIDDAYRRAIATRDIAMLSELIDLYSTTYAGTPQVAALVELARRQRAQLLAYLLASDVMRERPPQPPMPGGPQTPLLS